MRFALGFLIINKEKVRFDGPDHESHDDHSK